MLCFACASAWACASVSLLLLFRVLYRGVTVESVELYFSYSFRTVLNQSDCPSYLVRAMVEAEVNFGDLLLLVTAPHKQ